MIVCSIGCVLPEIFDPLEELRDTGTDVLHCFGFGGNGGTNLPRCRALFLHLSKEQTKVALDHIKVALLKVAERHYPLNVFPVLPPLNSRCERSDATVYRCEIDLPVWSIPHSFEAF